MTVISSRVKITCYLHVWRYEVFAAKLTWYFTGVYIIRIIIIQLCYHIEFAFLSFFVYGSFQEPVSSILHLWEVPRLLNVQQGNEELHQLQGNKINRG